MGPFSVRDSQIFLSHSRASYWIILPGGGGDEEYIVTNKNMYLMTQLLGSGNP